MQLKCADISIRIFMAAMYNGILEPVGGPDNWDSIYTEYVDLSGISENEQFNLMMIIHNQQQRIVQVQGYVDLERRCFAIFNEPFLPAFTDLKRWGHRLTWDISNPAAFLKQIDMIEIKEKQQVVELNNSIKELEDLKENGVQLDADSRQGFIKDLNRISRWNKYQIDKDKTDMESYALMIREHDEEIRMRALANQPKPEDD